MTGLPDETPSAVEQKDPPLPTAGPSSQQSATSHSLLPGAPLLASFARGGSVKAVRVNDCDIRPMRKSIKDLRETSTRPSREETARSGDPKPNFPSPKLRATRRIISAFVVELPQSGFVRNLVKPPKAVNSRQPPDSAAEINLKIWRVYPSGFASLETEIHSGASSESLRLLLFPETSFNNGQSRFARTHSTAHAELCPKSCPGTWDSRKSPWGSRRSRLCAQSHQSRLHGGEALRSPPSL